MKNLKISLRTQSNLLNVKKLNIDKMCQMMEVNLLSFYLMKLVDQAREVRFLMALRKKESSEQYEGRTRWEPHSTGDEPQTTLGPGVGRIQEGESDQLVGEEARGNSSQL